MSSESRISGISRNYGAHMDLVEVSRRLKAARWLAGGVKDNGKPAELKASELARRDVLVENGITANRIEEIEQLKVTPRPMELEKIAQALGVPRDWFVERVSQPVEGETTPAPGGALRRELEGDPPNGQAQPPPDSLPETGSQPGSGR